MEVIKRNGERAKFDENRVRKSMLYTGASKGFIDAVMERVLERIYNGITTKDLYSIVREEMKSDNVCFSCRYSLKEAISKLGPAGFKFEKYVASILNAYEYYAEIPVNDLKGACVNHEVDITAQKSDRSMFIEVKFRNNFSDHVDLQDMMAAWSRYLDLVDGASTGKCMPFDEAWLVTNGRFSDRAEAFGKCKGVKLLGWDYPKGNSLANMVDHQVLYPVTVIDTLTKDELEAMSEHGLMLCREVVNIDEGELAERIEVSESRSREVIELCRLVVEGA